MFFQWKKIGDFNCILTENKNYLVLKNSNKKYFLRGPSVQVYLFVCVNVCVSKFLRLLHEFIRLLNNS